MINGKLVVGVILNLALIFVLSSCSGGQNDRNAAVNERCCIDELSIRAINILESKASKGDMLAVRELEEYYALQGPESEHEKWMKKALEAGEPGVHIINALKNENIAKNKSSTEEKIIYLLEAKKSYEIALKNRQYINPADTPESVQKSLDEIDREIAKMM